MDEISSLKNSLREYVEQRIPLQEEEWQQIQAPFKPRQLAAQDYLLEAGKVCNHLFFLQDGLLRFFTWKNGEDKTKFFIFSPKLLTSLDSFSNRKPSLENIQALEDCRLLQADYVNLKNLYNTVPAWTQFINAIVREAQLYSEKLISELQNETAESRYKTILEQSPQMIRRIPLKHLASYLGIAPESLSRIRRRVLQAART